MQTDEQFASALSQSMHASTADLTYNGKVPARSHISLVVAPAAVAGLAGVALAVVATTHGGHPRPVAVGSSTPSPTAVPAQRQHPLTAKQLEIHKLKLAGYSLREGAGGTSGYYARVVDGIPSSAQPADDDATGVKAFVGVDPTTGLETAYVKSSTQIIAITSPDSTTVRLRVMLNGGAPQSVPLVGGN
jgi:hypothetical protein